MYDQTISEIGEKRLIRDYLTPFLNPDGNRSLVGDDCAIIDTRETSALCVSTDRVPHDLVSFRLGLIDYRGLGNYLAVLNISDIAAMGATPVGLLLNLGLPPDLKFKDLSSLLDGANSACNSYGCKIIGGDLSSSPVLSISATSLGFSSKNAPLYRTQASPGDCIYCTSPLGITSTAFYYHLKAKPLGLKLPDSEEKLLLKNFISPTALVEQGLLLANYSEYCTAMDNTDGTSQSFYELAELNCLGFELTEELLPFSNVSIKVSEFLNIPLMDVILGTGADFQLLGTCRPHVLDHLSGHGFVKIGEVITEKGLFLRDRNGKRQPLQPKGWNYFSNEF